MSLLHEAALRYAEEGYPVFPCVPGGKKPLTAHGFQDATTDPAQINAWWTAHPEANIGMPTAGLIVIDIDGADNPWPVDSNKRRDLGECPVSFTPRGGQHSIFRLPEGKSWRNTAGKLAPKVDTRADGGYIVLPPSVVGGVAYRWNGGPGLAGGSASLPEPPVWLTELIDGSGTPLSALTCPRLCDHIQS
ncbi:MAG: bifunctional DNA primase/polymerase [Deltaproteobacteria bacterium]|nr:bifunctional DNA primase/polymerase [Deltaproteobacteria bacterium]